MAKLENGNLLGRLRMSKNTKRDEKGNPILVGAQVFSKVVRPKGGRAQPKYFQYKDKAAYRLLMLMKNGQNADRLASKDKPVTEEELRSIGFQNLLASQNKVVQFAFHHSKLKELQLELKELLDSGNKRKIELLEQSIRREIEEEENILKELANSIKEGEK